MVVRPWAAFSHWRTYCTLFFTMILLLLFTTQVAPMRKKEFQNFIHKWMKLVNGLFLGEVCSWN
jgi:hypothetical protein